MALSAKEKDALESFYKGRELYDPSKAKEQEVATFMPKGMDEGGMAGCGYAEGGAVMEADDGSGGLSAANNPDPANLDVLEALSPGMGAISKAPVLPEGGVGQRVDDLSLRQENFNPQTFQFGAGVAKPGAGSDIIPESLAIEPRGGVPALTLNPDNFKPQPILGQPAAAPAMAMRDAVAAQEAPAAAPGAPARPAPPPVPAAGAGQPQARPGKLSQDEYDDLLASLKPGLGTRIGQGLSSAGATFADAVMQGVARQGNPGFAKNINEQRNQQKTNLINALREKYEKDYKGQELEQGAGRLQEEVAQHGKENAAKAAELAEQTRAHNLEAGTNAQRLKLEGSNQARQATQAQREADIKTVQDYGALKSGGPSKEVYEQAMARLQGQGAATKPMTATNKQTGHKIESTDGGQTWHNAK